MQIGEYIKTLRQRKGLSQEELGKIVGVQRAAVHKWESGIVKNLKRETIKKLADYFGVEPASFIIENIASSEKKYLSKTNNLLGNTVNNSATTANTTNDTIFPSEDITYMEIIGMVKAGYDGIAVEEHTGETVPIPTAFLKGRNMADFFVLRVSGNSMYPKLLDGDIVLVKRQSSVDSGSIAVVIYGSDKATIKTVKYATGENRIDLIPANPEYETKHIEGNDIENCRILGKVEKLIRDL